MTNQVYRLMVGVILLVSLYFESTYAIYGLIAMLLIEGITNKLIPSVITRWRTGGECDPFEGCLGISFKHHFRMGAERAWRFTVASMLVFGYVLYFDQLWFFPWFMGFAITGAGISGVCPVFLLLKKIGFR